MAGGNDEPQGFSLGRSETGGRSGGSLRDEFSEYANVRRRLVRHTLEEEGSIVTNALGGEGFLDGCTTRGGVDGVVFGTGGLNGWHFRLEDGSVTKGDGRGRALEGKSI